MHAKGKLLDSAFWWSHVVLHHHKASSVGCPSKRSDESLWSRSYLTLLGLKAKTQACHLDVLQLTTMT